MFIDTHCHLNFKAFGFDWRQVLESALKNQVEMVIVSTDLNTSQKAVEIASQYSGVWAAVGFHPIHIVDRDWRSEILKIRELVSGPEVVAVGEIGFDRMIRGERVEDEQDWLAIQKVQEQVFDFLVEAAAEFKKPLILHCREAMEVLKEKLALTINNYQLAIKGVQHCFPGDLAYAKMLKRHGFKVGFTGLVTYNPKWDKVIEQLDLEDILIETDSPYLTPVPYRGKRNEPSYVIEVAKHIAKIKGVDLAAVEKATYENAQALFLQN